MSGEHCLAHCIAHCKETNNFLLWVNETVGIFVVSNVVCMSTVDWHKVLTSFEALGYLLIQTSNGNNVLAIF